MAFHRLVLLFLCTSWLFVVVVTAQSSTTSSLPSTYTNPILNQVGADPWVIRHEDYYYMTYTTNDNITILQSDTLTNWDTAPLKLAFTPPPNKSYTYDLWAPELHHLNSKWYIIFTASVDPDSPPPETDMLCTYTCPAVNHRMFVLEGSNPTSPWNSTYTFKAELNTYDQFGLDGTYFSYDSKLYHVYSCWYDAYTSWPSMLCITAMSDPWTVTSSLSERTIISKPTQPWEKTPYNRTINDRLSSNEGPEQLTNPYTNQTFIIYSAARSDNRDYCLGLLEFNKDDLPDADPMDVRYWYKNEEGCVFAQNPEEEAYGVGHASFTTSPDGEEDWIVYHGMRDPATGWQARTIRTQQFTWSNETGWPVFPAPGYGPYAVPSGQ